MTAIVSHLGIRYATAERFEAPVLVPYENGAALGRAGAMAPQVPGMLEMALGLDVADTAEDCLFLNVWAPEGAANLPVLVWVHGGAYQNGAGSIQWYDGTNLAGRGSVVVTINYRLGALGYLGDGNWGLLDQVCALEWVRRHIADFGGDAGNVTIFGESAGGSSVTTLMGTPAADGLYHRAWAMSPSFNQVRDRESGARWLKATLDTAGVGSIDELRTIPIADLLAVQAKVAAMPATNYDMFSPTVGGEGLPADARERAAANPVPFCVGTNHDENLLFLAFDPNLAAATVEQWVAFTERELGERAAEARAVYEAHRPGATPLQLIGAVQTDHTFRVPAQRFCEARHAAGAPSWMYWFTWASPAFGGLLGSAHALDIPFAFDNIHSPGTEMLLGDGEERVAIASRFADEITTFAREGATSWPNFDPATRATLRLDATVELLHDPEAGIRSWWAQPTTA
jgi:para-nitrobenzyl esterase